MHYGETGRTQTSTWEPSLRQFRLRSRRYRLLTPLLVVAITVMALSCLAAPGVAAAAAYTITPSQSGSSVDVTCGAGQQSWVDFQATAGERLTVHATNWTFPGSENVSVYNLNGQYLWDAGWGNNATRTFTIPTAGSYRFWVNPGGSDAGSVTLTFYVVPDNNVYNVTPSTQGTTVSVSTIAPGQQDEIHFAATQGDRVFFAATGWAFPNQEDVSVYNANGSYVWNQSWGLNATHVVTMPSTGNYIFYVNPAGMDEGSGQITVYAVAANYVTNVSPSEAGTDVSLPATITPGQQDEIVFSAEAGERVFVGAYSWNFPGPEDVSVYNMNGAYVWNQLWSSNGTHAFDVPNTGTYVFYVNPSGFDTGSADINIYAYKDRQYSVTPSAGGSQVSVGTDAPGQQDEVAFYATAGSQVTVEASNWSFPGSENVSLYNANGAYVWDASWGNNASRATTIPSTGNYVFWVNPGGYDTGLATLTFTEASPDASLAQAFEPEFLFDSSEKWRPLNVDAFLSERDPGTGQAWNQICSPELGCAPLTGVQSLRQYTTADSYISIHRDGSSSPDSYVGPNLSCAQNPGMLVGVQLHDCDTGPGTAIYYHTVGPSPGGYEYLDYWAFYRYNQAEGDMGNHAGDWEGITVAPTVDNSGVSYVEMSNHGTWYAYLASSVACDGGAPGSCNQSGHYHVDTYPSAGSHANYPTPDSNPVSDNGNDGQAPWGGNLNAANLMPFPGTAGSGNAWTSGPENWTDWPGAWGDTPESGATVTTGSPCGPAASSGSAAGDCGPDHGPHYYAPWASGTGLNCSAGSCPMTRGRLTAPLGCSAWLGPSMAAVACDSKRLDDAVRTRTLGTRGEFSLTGSGHRSADGAGIAQLSGRGLHAGSRVWLVGRLKRGLMVLLRLQSGRSSGTAEFLLPSARQHRVEITVARGHRPKALLLIGRRRVVPVMETWTAAGQRVGKGRTA